MMKKQPFGILIIHGFASSLDSVISIESALKAFGLPIRMPILRGHGGKSPETLRGVTWHEWLKDAHNALDDLLCEVDRAVIIGHSMGGLLALHLAADQPDDIDSIILGAAAVKLASPLAAGRPLHWSMPLVLRLFKKWDLTPVYSDKSLAKQDTNYHWAPMDAIASFLELAEFTVRRLPEVRVPALIMQSRKDTTVAPESADLIYQSISTPESDKRILWFNQTDHEMFQDCERAVILGSIVAYVRERVGIYL
jgi:carboxylesterase